MPKPRIMFENDARHPLLYQFEPPLRSNEYEIAVDELAGTPVEALMFGIGEGRTVLHDSKAGNLWGKYVEKWPELYWRRAYQNVRHLIEQGRDSLAVICDRAHAKGILVYPTLLLQKGHRELLLESWESEAGADGSSPRTGDARLEIRAAGDLDPSFPAPRGLNFMHDEVRQERLALIEEVLARYPVDGLELELSTVPYHFHPNEAEEGRKTMTEWMGRVYEAVKSSGADRELAIHIPADIEFCRSVGLDVHEWIGGGIVDVLIGDVGLADPNADFRPLVEAAKGSDCRIHAAFHINVDSDRLATAPIEMVRAIACNYWAQGIDGLYLAGWQNSWPFDASFYEKLREIPHPDVMAPKDKYYRVLTKTSGVPEAGTTQLPADLEVGVPVRVGLTISDDLHRLDQVGRVHRVLLRVRVMQTSELDSLSFKLNGAELPESCLRKINEMYRIRWPRHRAGTGYWFVFSLDSEHWPVTGKNTLEVTLLERDAVALPQIHVNDVELAIEYLRGRNAHRGSVEPFVDPDIGPYDHVV